MCEALSRALRRQNGQGRLGVIAELKRRRADGIELIRDRSLTDIARTYQQAGAAALSVVTSRWFGGSLDMLEQVAAAKLGLPILRKDLISTPRDVQVSKQLGASAVLLVLPLLGIKRVSTLLPIIQAESLEPFVEVATRDEIRELQQIYDGIIAVNNSDIKTNEVEGEGISRSIALVDRGDPRLWVSASGINGPQDVRQVADAGFDGILIGTHLLLADDLGAATDRIMVAARRDPARINSVHTARPILKVCGVTTPEEVQHLSHCGVDYFGLQVDMPSPWTISVEQATQLAAQSAGRMRATLITKPADPDRIAKLIQEIGVTAIQLSPLTPPAHIRQLRSHFRPEELIVMQEISYRGGAFWKEELVEQHLAAGADYILIDPIRTPPSDGESARGPIPESELAAFRLRHPDQPTVIAGAISADNARSLLAASGARGIDVCSSVRKNGTIQRELVAQLMARIQEPI